MNSLDLFYLFTLRQDTDWNRILHEWRPEEILFLLARKMKLKSQSIDFVLLLNIEINNPRITVIRVELRAIAESENNCHRTLPIYTTPKV